jgi:transglutaminase-like putative cysteine protease
MIQRHPQALVAGAATLLAAMPLTAVFATYTWLLSSAIAVTLISGTAMGVRSRRGPLWAQVLAMAGVLTLYLTWMFPSGDESMKFLPSLSTFRHLGKLLNDASVHVRNEAVPVGDFDGLLLLTIAGVGLVAIVVDFLAVGIRRPALAGLPMLAIYSVPVAVLPKGLSFLPFGFAAAGYLWLLATDSVDRVRRFGRRLTGEGREVDVREPSPLASAGRRLAVVGIIVAIMLPLAVPGTTSGLFDRFDPGSGTGRSARVSGPTVDMFALLDGALIREEAFTMIKVTTNDPAPYYLRFGVADQITNNGFASRAPTSGQRLADGLGQLSGPTTAGVTVARYHAQIEAVNFDMRLAPVYVQPTASRGLDGSWFFDSSTNQLFSSGESLKGRSYGFDYVRLSYPPSGLRTAGPLNDVDPRLRQLASVPPVPQVVDIAAQLTAHADTEYDKVLAILDHFRSTNGFVYSLQTEPGTSGHPIVDFLTNKRGFCAQYAAAMAWLVRAAGYPARVAFGFTRGGPPQNGATFLTNLNLHAWTEVFFPDFGWIPFDATPSASVIGSAPTVWAPDPSDRPRGDSRDGTPGPVTTAPPVGPTVQGSEADGGSSGASAVSGLWWLVAAGGAALLLMAFLAPAIRRRSLRKSRLARSGSMIVVDRTGPPGRADPGTTVLALDAEAIEAARRDAHAAWAELLDMLIDFDVAVDEAETPRLTGDRLGQLPGLMRVRDQALLLARAEERARYARAPLHPHGLDAAVRATSSALAQRATRRQRLKAILMPRSVVLRWRLAWVGRVKRSIGFPTPVHERAAAPGRSRIDSVRQDGKPDTHRQTVAVAPANAHASIGDPSAR